MRAVIQRVTKASVSIDKVLESEIGPGMLILLGIEEADTFDDIQWLCGKISKLRIFDDSEGVMNLSITDVKGEMLVVSQFTLHASTRKGNRPSYIKAARPESAIPLYEKFIAVLQATVEGPVQTGEFGAMMQVALVNDGPVTIIIDSKLKE